MCIGAHSSTRFIARAILDVISIIFHDIVYTELTIFQIFIVLKLSQTTKASLETKVFKCRVERVDYNIEPMKILFIMSLLFFYLTHDFRILKT